MRTLLFIGGGREAVPGIERARALGLRTLVFDAKLDAPGARAADEAVVASTHDPEAAEAAARSWEAQNGRLAGVISVAHDVPHTVARVAEALGLCANSSATAALSIDKLAQKRALAAAGLPIPWFAAAASAGELARRLDERRGPLVVKPPDSRGARGVSLLASPDRAEQAFAWAVDASPSRRVMVEEHLDGPQVSSETLFVGGRPYTVGFSDRNYARLAEFAPFFIEDGGEQPSRLEPRQRRDLTAVVEAAGRALGITDGPCKGDLVWTARGPFVIEVAARLSGGWFCTDQIPLATGVDLVGLAIRQALGEPIRENELAPSRSTGAACRYFFPAPGRVVACDGPAAWMGPSWVHRLELFCGVGDELALPTDHARRAGCVVTSGRTRDEAVARASSVAAGFRIETRRAA